jgi:predicted DNA-binding transcriptional regulator AlpA
MSDSHPFGGQFLTRQAVAARLRLDVKTLDSYRRQSSKKFPPPKFKWGRSPMWRDEDIDQWLSDIAGKNLDS